MGRVDSANGEERWVSNTARGDRHSRARSIPHAWPDLGIPNDFIGQRQFDGYIVECPEAASRKSSCAEADEMPQAR